ncbi:MAG TPA: Rid family detoxifying hydrolase [Polyangiaceae bacterium]|jgi:2-iminobutanoate/2-iminopropanoate deaminase|nr:Rid family detoxifying hydrolase [Polyangiaceae bacterium]
MSREVILSLDAPKPVSAYSQAIKDGSLLFLAGQIPLDPVSGQLVTGDIAAETERIIENMRAVLTAAGASLSNVVKTTVYLTNMSDFAAFNQAYSRHFVNQPPARTTVAVLALPLGARVEIEAIAALP